MKRYMEIIRGDNSVDGGTYEYVSKDQERQMALDKFALRNIDVGDGYAKIYEWLEDSQTEGKFINTVYPHRR